MTEEEKLPYLLSANDFILGARHFSTGVIYLQQAQVCFVHYRLDLSDKIDPIVNDSIKLLEYIDFERKKISEIVNSFKGIYKK